MDHSTTNSFSHPNRNLGGIRVTGTRVAEVEEAAQDFHRWLRELGLDEFVKTADGSGATPPSIAFRLAEDQAEAWAPSGDTTQLGDKLQLDTRNNTRDLEKEILLAMLVSPVPLAFPTFGELESAVRIRQNVVATARQTLMTFDTQRVDRPGDYWTYDDDRGFLLVPGQPLIEALLAATRPGGDGRTYAFSCRRAVEYLVLLGIAAELLLCNPDLYSKLERQLEIRAIKGEEFEKVFLRPFGSRADPLPVRFFVPGDWVWFKNPDSISAEAPGCEGSHTIYLGCGAFADFWNKERTDTLTSKCLSIFHWRTAARQDEQGAWQVDGAIVEEFVQETLKDPAEVDRILREMLCIQEPPGVFGGGCIEPNRDCARFVRPGTSDLRLPDVGPC